MKLKMGKGILKAVGKAAKEAGEEAAEQGVKQIIKQSPKHIKKMTRIAVDETGKAVKKGIKTVSGNADKWKEISKRIGKKAKDIGEETTKNVNKRTLGQAYEDFLESKRNKKRTQLTDKFKYIFDNPNADPKLVQETNDFIDKEIANMFSESGIREKYDFFKSLFKDKNKVVEIDNQKFHLNSFSDPALDVDGQWKSGASFFPLNVDNDGNAKMFDFDNWVNARQSDTRDADKHFNKKIDEMLNNPNITVEDMDYNLKKQKIHDTQDYMKMHNEKGKHSYSADDMEKKINGHKKNTQSQTHPEANELPINGNIGELERQLYNANKNPNPNYEFNKGKNFDIEISKHNHQTSKEKNQAVNDIMDQFKTAEEMNGESGNNFNANDFSENTPLDFDTDDDAYNFIEREDFKYRRKNGHVDRIRDKQTGETYRVVRNDKGDVIAFTDSNDASISKEKANELFEQVQNERSDFINNMTDRDWDKAYREHAFSDTYSGERYGFNSKEEVLGVRKQVLDNEIDGLEQQIDIYKNYKDKGSKQKYKDMVEKQKKLKSKKAGIEYREGSIRREYTQQQAINNAEKQFNKAVEGMDPSSTGYQEAKKVFDKQKEQIAEEIANGREYAKEFAKGQIASFNDNSSALSKIGKGISTAFTVKSAVDKYKESRAEGRSMVSSAVRAGASAAAADMIGPVGGMALGLAQAIPGAVIGATSFVASEYRRMNSAANYTPLGGTTFQDSQQLATMRQSGMELAKMSQYNLEQTLMGAEAKHLHR